MSVIDKLSISGIRSFSPEEQNVIQLFTPLTLIVGHNGAGKTTVIECLKYATIGDLPPNSQKSFVHDPKLANASEVKAQVRLKFRNINGKKMTAVRSLSMTQKKNVSSQKTLESLLSVETDSGKTVSITSKCAELDAAIPEQLGVSRAIIDNVIFCHQEDSFWPLAEPAVLKKKFDEIFASTRYTKALDAIKALRKDQTVQIKLDQAELGHLKGNLDRADNLKSDRDEIKAKIESAIHRKQQLETGEIAQISNQLRGLERDQQRLQNLYSEIQQREMKRNLLASSVAEMKDTIELYEDSDEQLKSMLDQYQDSIEIQQMELAELNDNESKYSAEIGALEADISRLLTLKGQLHAEVEANERRLAQGEEMVVNAAKKFGIRGFSSTPLNLGDMGRFIAKLNESVNSQIHVLDTLKTEAQGREAVIMARLQKAQAGITSQQESKKITKRSMDATRTKIAEAHTKIQNLSVSQSELTDLQAKISEETNWITNAKTAFTPAETETKIAQLNQDISTCDHVLVRLSDEMSVLNMQSDSRARLSLKVAEVKRKEETVRNVWISVSEGFKKAVGRDINSDTYYNDIANELAAKERQSTTTKALLESKTTEMSALDAKLDMTRTRLSSLTREVETKSKQIHDATSGSDFLLALADAEQDYEDELSAEKTIASANVMIGKYMRMFNRDKCCPLCIRGFATEEEERGFLKRLNDTLSKIPDKANQAISLAEKLSTLKQLQILKTTYDEITRLRDTEIPLLKTNIRNLEQTKQECASALEDAEGDYAALQVEVCGLVELKARVMEMDKLKGDVEVLKEEVRGLQLDLAGSGSLKTLGEVQEQYKQTQLKSKNLRREMDRLNNELRSKQREMQSHDHNLQELKTKLQEKSFLWQERERLQNSISEMKTEIEKFVRDIEVADSVLQELNPTIHEIQQELTTERDASQTKASTAQALLQDLRTTHSTLQTHHTETTRFPSTQSTNRRRTSLDSITLAQSEIARVAKEQTGIKDRVAAISKSASEVVVVQRAVQDNLKVREMERTMEVLAHEIVALKGQVGKVDVGSVQTQRKKLTEQYERLCEEQAGLAGELKQMEEQLKRLDRDLEKDFGDVVEKYARQVVKLKTETLATHDLEKYSKALENAIMKYHSMKMDEINKIIRELWVNTYKGNDIETIEIRSDNENSTAKNRSYNYRVVMLKERTELDMRGRCSAGQKVLACLIIRLALAETFCLNCGILALDEPTTNLDRDNSDALAESLSKIIQMRRQQKNFQLIIITHDEEFMQQIGHHEYADYYWRVSKDGMQHSVIEKQRIL